MMLICGGGYNGLGCDLMIDPISEEYDSFWIVEFDAYVIMHVHCADLAGLDIDTWR
jgi:hypothetical protein